MVLEDVREKANDVVESFKQMDDDLREFVCKRVKSLLYKDGNVYYAKYGVLLNLSDLNIYNSAGFVINNAERLKKMMIDSFLKEYETWLVEEEKVAQEIINKLGGKLQ